MQYGQECKHWDFSLKSYYESFFYTKYLFFAFLSINAQSKITK